MARTFYLALVNSTDGLFTDGTFDPAFARHDEHVRSFTVAQSEGGFASLTVVIERPSQSLLDPARPQWAWLSFDDGSGVTPLFNGRVIGIPDNIQNEFYTVEFNAKPANFDEQKRLLAATLKVAPYWDYAFIDPQSYDDPDAVLEARTDAWHIDRVTLDVTTSSIIAGEDTLLAVPASAIPHDGFSLSYGDAPLRKVQLEMRAMWTQILDGEVDLTADILAAFGDRFVKSYTGQGLYNAWPVEGDAMGNAGIWTFGPQVINVADGKSVQKSRKRVYVQYERAPNDELSSGFFGFPIANSISIGGLFAQQASVAVDFRLWAFSLSSSAKYHVELSRIEDIQINVVADVQDVVNSEADETAEVLQFSSGAIGITVGEDAGLEVPISDLSRSEYFSIARGHQSIEFGLAHARSLLARRARSARITCRVPFDVAIEASLRKSATVTHPGLPGGQATGKIVAYEFGVDGGNGVEGGSITIACMVGKNSTIVIDAGTPTYAAAEYVGSDYQAFDGREILTIDGEMKYRAPVNLTPSGATFEVVSCTVTNGYSYQADQANVLSRDHGFLDVAAACDAVNSIATQVDLVMSDVDLSARYARYQDSQVFLVIPKGIDLGSVST